LRTVANVETYQIAKALVAHGGGVALIDEITARSSGHDNVVARYLEPPLQFDISILHTISDPFSVITQRFINHLKKAMGAFLQPPLGC
jgi:DNA-binding transcriptional LysR family regulator